MKARGALCWVLVGATITGAALQRTEPNVRAVQQPEWSSGLTYYLPRIYEELPHTHGELFFAMEDTPWDVPSLTGSMTGPNIRFKASIQPAGVAIVSRTYRPTESLGFAKRCVPVSYRKRSGKDFSKLRETSISQLHAKRGRSRTFPT